jgi:hypothetical protein
MLCPPSTRAKSPVSALLRTLRKQNSDGCWLDVVAWAQARDSLHGNVAAQKAHGCLIYDDCPGAIEQGARTYLQLEQPNTK